jgi:hypothetical protein
MNLTQFPMSAEFALRLVREAAADGRNYTIPDPPDGGEWYRIVNRRQVELCMRSGDLVGKPHCDDLGNVHVTLERFSAGVLVRLTVVLWRRDATSKWEIAITKVEHGP